MKSTISFLTLTILLAGCGGPDSTSSVGVDNPSTSVGGSGGFESDSGSLGGSDALIPSQDAGKGQDGAAGATGGSTETGGTPNVGGSQPGVGGSAGSGGLGTGGAHTGGSPNVGGTPNVGGSPATGGSPGTGGTVCVPKTQADACGIKCDIAVSDGCTGQYNCACGASQACQGGQCVCAKIDRLVACANKDCGTAPDGCGSNWSCGSNGGGCQTYFTCGLHNANKCECDPTPKAIACANAPKSTLENESCGLMPDGCGGQYDCASVNLIWTRCGSTCNMQADDSCTRNGSHKIDCTCNSYEACGVDGSSTYACGGYCMRYPFLDANCPTSRYYYICNYYLPTDPDHTNPVAADWQGNRASGQHLSSTDPNYPKAWCLPLP